jgi:HEAT repeat protein
MRETIHTTNVLVAKGSKMMMRKILVGAFAVGALLVGATAQAGRGGSYGNIKSAINSGSVDAIVGEIERAEHLVCLSCVDIVRPLIDHPSEKVRDVAAWWLVKRGVMLELRDEMTARLTVGQDPIAARNAADVLAGFRDPAGLPALASYLAKPLDEESARHAARAIGVIGHPQGLPALKVGMQSTMAGVRVASLQAVRNLRAPVGQRAPISADVVTPMLADPDPAVRREAAYTLGWLRDKSAVAQLAPMVTGDASAIVRKAAAWALGRIGVAGDSTATAALTAALNDADPLVRSIARGALGGR